jgi:hypothetical protein
MEHMIAESLDRVVSSQRTTLRLDGNYAGNHKATQ